ncbi:MAG: PEP-CTERM sorting domain-containing protein [Phycisphaerae bacterium]|nr:PEP-CTERM sorting domain-containing protein [Phycisphaerae bacterium]
MKPRLASILLVCLITANLFAGPYYADGQYIHSYADRLADGSIALMIELTSAPVQDIILINNSGSDSVIGVFDDIYLCNNVIFNVNALILTYDYFPDDAVSNDIALLVPEPATLILFALGGLVLRRKR